MKLAFLLVQEPPSYWIEHHKQFGTIFINSSSFQNFSKVDENLIVTPCKNAQDFCKKHGQNFDFLLCLSNLDFLNCSVEELHESLLQCKAPALKIERQYMLKPDLQSTLVGTRNIQYMRIAVPTYKPFPDTLLAVRCRKITDVSSNDLPLAPFHLLYYNFDSKTCKQIASFLNVGLEERDMAEECYYKYLVLSKFTLYKSVNAVRATSNILCVIMSVRNHKVFDTRRLVSRYTRDTLSKYCKVLYAVFDADCTEAYEDEEFLVLPGRERWECLPLKVHLCAKYAVQQKYDSMIKIDDDVIFKNDCDASKQVEMIFEHAKKCDYVGKEKGVVKKGDTSEYHLSRVGHEHALHNKKLAFDKTVEYAGGPFYILSRNGLSIVASENGYKEMQQSVLEDYSVGKLMSEAGIALQKVDCSLVWKQYDELFGSSEKRYIVPKLGGGFGNQLYVMAYCLKESNKHDRTILYDATYLDRNTHSKEDYAKSVFQKCFDFNTNVSNCKTSVECKECPKFSKRLSVHNKDAQLVKVQGYVQYHDILTPTFFAQLTLPKVPNISCFLHIRGGDYLKLPDFYIKLGLDYYNLAAKCFPQGTVFTVFTNDMQFATSVLQDADFSWKFAEPNKNEIHDWTAMANAELGGICANSTYSFSAAAYNRNRIIVVPRTFVLEKQKIDMQRIYDPAWIVLEHENRQPFYFLASPYLPQSGQYIRLPNNLLHAKYLIQNLDQSHMLVLKSESSTIAKVTVEGKFVTCSGTLIGCNVQSRSFTNELDSCSENTVEFDRLIDSFKTLQTVVILNA